MASRSAAVSIRGVRPGDVGRLQAIQLAAGDAFRDVGMSSIAESPPLAAESLSGYREAGRAWAAVDDHDEPVGFVVAALGAGGRDGGSERVCMRRDVPPGTGPGADAKS